MTTPFHKGGEGEPLVLLHGFTDTWRAWRPLLPALERHHAVFAPTLPGHHGGAVWETGLPMSVDALVNAVERLLDAEGIERAHIAGSSLGGWLALELALRGRALSVVGLCPAGGWEPHGRVERHILRYFHRNIVLMPLSGRLFEPIAKRPRLRALALREIIARPAGVSATTALDMFQGSAGCTVAAEWLRAARATAVFGDLGEIDCPVRIAYGTRDWLIRWPVAYERLQRLLPDAEFVALEGLGHLPMHDDPELVAQTILEVTSERVASAAA